MEEILIYDRGMVISRAVAGSLEEIAARLAEMASGSTSLHAVCDRNVTHVAERLFAEVGDGVPDAPGMFVLDASEKNKTMGTVLDICGWLMESGADRNSMLFAIGGGIVTDMAGFAASIYMRGIRFAYLPTTLLAQVDASVGGKTGVNYNSYKNMLGVIRQPECTFICADVLDSLPERDFLSGASEMIKSFLIEDGGNYRRAVDFMSSLRSAGDRKAFLASHMDELSALIHAAVGVKAGIVSRDQFESGERRKLNLGHTFAHAIEKNARSAGLDITHGEAVSVGMVMAARLAEKTGYAETGYAGSLKSELDSVGLMTECPFSVQELVDAMRKDKKTEGGIIHFVLVAGPGMVKIEDMAADRAAELLK